MYELSVIIPARNEQFLGPTIADVFAHAGGDTEVIAVLDGYWPAPALADHERLTVIRPGRTIGQRAAVNAGARVSQAKYIMKLDAHCALADGFDQSLIADCQPDWTIIPQMYNLHAFDWACQSCKQRTYQGPQPETCAHCGDNRFEQKLVWRRREHKLTQFWRFDRKLKFQYWYDYHKRPAAAGAVADTMSAIGACFFMARERFFALDGLDEGHGGWGQMGTEIACKTWLSGGRHVVSKNTWFAHMFRTNNKGFSFPYPISGAEVSAARKYSKSLWLNDAWPKAVHKLSWLVEKFAPVPDWHDAAAAPSNAPPAKAAPVKRPGLAAGEIRRPPASKGKGRRPGGPTLSVLIPARNEKFLQATIDDIVKNFTSDYEIIVGLDDYDPDPPIKEDARIRVYRADHRIGMRALINHLAGLARGRFIMKTDAHCAFDTGYDQKLMDHCTLGITILGVRYELDTAVWQRRERTNCDFRYLSNPFVDEKGGLRGLPDPERQQRMAAEPLAESMSLSGSGWLMQKAQFEYWGGLDENHGTMYQEGAEIACKTWLSGGRLLINRETWYAHHNRGKAPYALSSKQRQKSINYSIDLWKGNQWPKQKYSFDWLIEKFAPPGWPPVAYDTWPAPAQGTLLKGAGKLAVKDLWRRRLDIAEPAKRHRLEIFFKVFKAFLAAADVVDDCGYYHYLMGHRSKNVIYRPDAKMRARTLAKMRAGLDLYRDIKKNGLRAPLEFYARDNALILFRGYRRLVILHLLGRRSAAARIHKDERTAKHLTPAFDVRPGTINELGADQFAELGAAATDKYYVHNYLEIYDSVLGHLRGRKIKLLEIGILRGASVALWRRAFPRAAIVGVEKNLTTWKKFAGNLENVDILVGNTADDRFLTGRVLPAGPFDVVIDDGDHNPAAQLALFDTLWPALAAGGFYIIEDTYRSYRPGHEGVNVPAALAGRVADIYSGYAVRSLQFFYNLCIIQKGM